ncbi:S8 family peptidase [Cohnella lubricantis]|uniref:S8 family peptidase n=1 Tax=Cohnella lubricantis TaxID=2163172 RepID=A0A841TH56_9BACL|nr:S8 family peptidase [Cohnella lubricantis]MBB6679475.1 S8 family peptidase [Cohnella lubricantis]MBP2118212.1 subtilisin family serine protease [Cohnella lubricantis]
MDTNSILEWLKSSLSSSEKRASRRILRFLRPEDDKIFLKALQAERPRHRPLREVKRLGIIRAYSCPLPPQGMPLPFGAGLVWEEDPLISMHAAPLRPSGSAFKRTADSAPRSPRRSSKPTRVRSITDQGIPWGVRRIRAPEAWSRTTGHRVKVGVIDTGVDFSHPDLSHSLERGINLIQRTMPPHDDNGHGTHIAGTIAAANRLQGMIGVAPRASIYPIKAFDYNGTAFVSDIILGIDWCVRNRMDVVNMSFGMENRSKSLLAAVSNAYRSGVLIVASSGNDGKRGQIDYPARYRQTVAVGAINRLGKVASFSNRCDAVDIYAPGEKILSSWPRGGRKFMSGTSMATSHVTGAVALLLGLKPELTPEQIKAILKRSTRPLRSGKSRGAGELDVTRMLLAAKQMP